MPEETDDDDDDDEAERVGEGGAWRAFLSPLVVVVGSNRGVLAQDDMAEGLSTRFARRKVKNAIKQFVSRAIPIPPSWFPLLSSLCLFFSFFSHMAGFAHAAKLRILSAECHRTQPPTPHSEILGAQVVLVGNKPLTVLQRV